MVQKLKEPIPFEFDTNVCPLQEVVKDAEILKKCFDAGYDIEDSTFRKKWKENNAKILDAFKNAQKFMLERFEIDESDELNYSQNVDAFYNGVIFDKFKRNDSDWSLIHNNILSITGYEYDTLVPGYTNENIPSVLVYSSDLNKSYCMTSNPMNTKMNKKDSYLHACLIYPIN